MKFKAPTTSKFDQLGRVGVAPEESAGKKKEHKLADISAAAISASRPRKQYSALEARILFDAAGASAADHQLDNPEEQYREAQRIASEQASAAESQAERAMQEPAALPAPEIGNTIVVIDSRVTNYQDLLKDIDPAATVRVIGENENGIDVISQLLGTTGNVSSLQIVSHGQPGFVMLGNAVLDSAALDNANTAAQLQGWQSGMTSNADILILGCDVAQGEKGKSFVQKLADLTRADISASVDDTGAASKGGNWLLEFNVGQVESFYAFSEVAMQNYDQVLVAGPDSTLTVPATSLIGSTGNKASVTFDNTGTVGYSPYLVVGFDRTGQDANNNGNPTEGVVYKPGSAKLNSGTVASETIINNMPAGNFTVPGLVDGLGALIVFNAADYGLSAGDQLVIWQLPFGSFTPDQPAARIDFEYNVGINADSGNTVAEGGQGAGKELRIVSKAFFAFGDSPSGAAAITETVADAAPTNPKWFTTQYINTSRELEQVPGANDKQQFQAVLNIAPGQEVKSGNGVINLANPGTTPDRYISRLSIPQIAGTSAASFNISDITLTQGPGLTAPLIPGATQYFVVDKTTGAPAIQNPNGTWSSPNGPEIIAIAAANTTITGSPTLNFEYFIVNNVIDPATGADIPQTFDAKHTGTVDFADGDDANALFVADPAPILIEYETIQIQKSVAGPYADALAAPIGDLGVNPNAVRSGDTLTYTLTIQVSDFNGLRNVVVTDVLPDGVDFNVGSMRVSGANVNGQVFAPIANAGAFMTDALGTLGTYTIPRQADEGGSNIVVGGNGKQALQLNLSTALAANGISNTGIGGAVAGDLLGDKFGTASGQGLTTVTITYTATVRDTYRVAANGNTLTVNGSAASANLLENDVLKNDVRVHGNLLTNAGNGENAAAAITSGVINADESAATVTIKDGALLLEVYAINGDTTFPKQGGRALIAPGDNVTYRIRYDLAQGDFNNLKLETFLPDPIFKATDINADGTASGTAEMIRIDVASRQNLNGSLGSTANWAQAGAYTLGPAHNNGTAGSGGITDTPAITSLFVDNSAAGNRVQFNLGDSSRTTNPGGTGPNAHTSAASQKIDLLFTVKAQDGQNFSDDLLLTAQGRETSERSGNGGVAEATPLPDDRIIQLKLIAPTLSVKHGLIATGGAGGATGDQNGVVSGLAIPGGAVIKAAGDASAGAAITGLSPTKAITSGAALDSNIAKVDAGDTVRGALSIVNESRAGAYDVRTTNITPPPGYRFASNTTVASDAANNVKVMRGDGELLVLGTDYTFVGNKIEFVDKDRAVVLERDGAGNPIATRPIDGKPDAVLLAGKDGEGNLRTDGQNVIIITYDMVVDNDGLANATNSSVAASSTTSTAGIDQYSASNGFGNTPAGNIINAAPLTDIATSTIAAPEADIRWAGDATSTDKTPTASDTTATQTTAGNAVIGEAGFFDILITIPEGDTKDFSADVNLPPGLKLDTTFTPAIFTTAFSDINDAGGSQLTNDWRGAVPVVQSTAAINPTTGTLAGTLGNAGVGVRLNFGNLSNPQDNNKLNNQFVIRVKAIVVNTQANDTTSPSGNNQAHNPNSGIPAEPNGASGNQAGILRTTTSSSNYRSGADALSGTGGTIVNIDDTTTANDPTITIVEPTVTTVVTAKVVDVDPSMAGDQPSPDNAADENDIVEYTVTLTNPTSGSINAYDLKFAQVLPPEVDLTSAQPVGIISATRGLTAALSPSTLTGFDVSGVPVTAGQFEIVGNTVQTKGGAAGDAASNLDLAPGETIVLKVRARVNSSAAANPSFSSTATTQWTSIDSANNLAASQDANERTGADGLLQGALTGTQADLGTGTTSGTGANQASSANGLNDYRTASRGDINVAAIEPVLSRIGGLSDTSPSANNAAGNTKDGSPSDGKAAQNMAVGEITRFRMVVKVPAGVTPGFVLQPTLPVGYTYLGGATLGLVSDTAMTTSAVTGAGLNMGDGTGVNSAGSTEAWGNIQNNLSAPTYGASASDPRATGTKPVVAITANTATAGSPRFELGTLTNTDNDTDSEYVVIEFNAVVNNAAAVQAGTNLDTSFRVLSNSGAGEVVRATSNITRDVVVEPDIAAVVKNVIDVQRTVGNTATAQGTVENTITAQSSFTVSNAPNTTAAYNVMLADGFINVTGANDLAVDSVKIGSTTFAANALPPGVALVTTASGYTLTFDKLDPGTTVEVIYKVDVPVATNVASSPTTNNATVTWSGLPDAAGWEQGANVFAGSPLGADGAPGGERDGTGGLASVPTNIANQTGPLNNYQVKDSAGYSTITGTLWDDTNTADGMIQAGERLLDGVTVTLNWAGADGMFGNADDRTITTLTDTSGKYNFGALPLGNYKITAPTSVTRADSGDGIDNDALANRFDRTDGDTGTLAIGTLTIAEGTATIERDFGYIQPNDPPVNSFNGSSTFPTAALPFASTALQEDTIFAFTAANNALVTIADPDGNQGTGQLTTTLVVTNGTLAATNGGSGATVAGTGSSTITLTGTQAQINTALATLQYTPTNNYSGPATITVTTNDQGQGGTAGGDPLLPREPGGTTSPDALVDIDVIHLNVAPVSDAPFLTVGNTNLGGSQATSPGSLGTGLGNSATQTVAGAATGLEDTTIPLGLNVTPTDTVGTSESLPTLTITGVPAGWQLIGGTTTVTSTGLTDVFTIPAGDVALLGIKPLADVNSTTTPPATLTIKATSLDGAGNPTAETTGTLTIGVIPVNDRPVLTNAAVVDLGTIPEGTPNSVAQTVGTLFGPRFSDPKDGTEPNGQDAIKGVFITGTLANPTTEGVWEYSTDGGATFTAVPTGTADGSAIYLDNASQIRFKPLDANYSGTPGQLTVRLVETEQTPAGNIVADVLNGAANGTTIGNSIDALASGAVVDLSGPVGTAAQFATGRVSEPLNVAIVITPVSDAPVLTIGTPAGEEPGAPGTTGQESSPGSPATGNNATGAVTGSVRGLEDTAIPLGISVANADTTNPEAVTTVVISGVPTGWIVKDSAGNVIPTPGGSTAGLTPAQLTGATITAPADVNSTGPSGTSPAATLTVTVSSTDGTAPAAVTTGTLNVAVIPVNDRPVLTNAAVVDLGTIPEGTPNSVAQTVGTLFGPRFSDPKDGTEPNGQDAIKGVFITGTLANPTTEGVWEYSTDGGATFTAVPTGTADGSAIYLDNASQIRFKPLDANYSGTPGQLTVRLVETEQTPAGNIVADVLNGAANGTTIGNSIDALASGAVVDLSGPVGTAAQFATGRVSEPLNVAIVITPVSDAPVLTIGTPAGEEPGAPGTTGQESSPGSPATGNNATGAVTGSVRGLEDTAIPLGISVANADTTNPEAVTTVVISGVPTGWIVKDSAGNVIPTPGGSTAGLTPAQLTGATITAPADVNSTGPSGTSPAATLTVTVSSTDGTAPAAVTTGTLNVAVIPVNDRPVLTNAAVVDLGTIPEGTPNSVAQTVGTLFGPRFSDPKDGTEPNGQDAIKGVFITGTLANPTTEGVWEYSTDGGATFTAVPTGTADGSAIYLDNASQIRFKPLDANYSGTPGQLTVRLVETEQTPAGNIVADVLNGAANGTTIGNSIDALASGAVVDLSGPVGTAAQFATGRVSEPLNVAIVITPVSDAPVLTIGTPAGEEPGAPGTTGQESSPGSPATGNNATGAVTGSVRGLEDTAIPLGISVANADTTNPEAVTTVVISGVPTGWIVKDSAGNVIPTPGGSTAGLTPAQLTGATITAPADVNSTGPSGTSPAATLTVTVSSTDGTAPAAVTTGTLNVAVIPVNDRPVLTNAAVVDLGTIPEGTPNSVAQTVGTLFGPRFSDPKDGTEPNGQDAIKGVFITGTLANPTTEGVWEYSTDGGATFTAVPTGTADGSAIYLDNASQIRFKPLDANYSGTPGQLTVRLVETEQTPAGNIVADVLNGAANGTTIGNSIDALASGAVVDLSGPVGTAAQFATGRVSEPLNVAIVITPVSDAPVLTIGTPAGEEPGAPGTTGQESSPGSPATGNNATGAVTGSVRGLEDTAIPLGISVANADTTNPEAVTTVVISGVPTGWIVKDSAGNVIPTPGGSTAGLTPAQLTGATITAPADVNSTGPSGTSPAATLTVTVSSTDGTAPAAVTTGTLNVAVIPVNDAPLFPTTTTVVLPAFNEDNPSSSVDVAVAFPGYTDPKDTGEPNGADTRVGVLLTANAATEAQGNWEYFDGTSFVPVPRNLSDTNALYLPDGTPIRFNPALNFNGTPGNLTARLVEDDQTATGTTAADLPTGTTSATFGATNVIRTGLDLSAGVGGTSRVSANTRDVSINVDPVNDTPVVVTPGSTPVTALPVGDVPISFKGANSIVLSDVDTPFNPSAIVTVTITPTGNGRPFISALTPGVTQASGPPVGTIPPAPGTPIVLTGTIADINATLQNLEYRSRQFYNGTDSFTVQINDNANGGPGPLQAIQTVNVDNTPLNDRPVPISTTSDYAALASGDTSPGRSIQDMFGARFSDPRDAPTTNGGDVFAGVAIISTPPASQGVYQFSTDGGNTWTAIAAGTTPANAVVLGPNAQLRFVANPAFTGETTPLQAVLIETDQPGLPAAGVPGQGDLLGRPGVPLDGATSVAPVSGTILNLSALEATEASTTTNGIGRSRFSSLANPMTVGIRIIDPPVAPQQVVPPADFSSPLTLLPAVLTQFAPAADTQFISDLLEQVQAEVAAQQAATTQAFNSFNNAGLQPNWLMAENLGELTAFAAPLPEAQVAIVAPPEFTPRRVLTPEEIALREECAKPRAVVAKPRPPGFVAPPRPTFEPGSPAAKRFSEQLKRARELRAKCATLPG